MFEGYTDIDSFLLQHIRSSVATLCHGILEQINTLSINGTCFDLRAVDLFQVQYGGKNEMSAINKMLSLEKQSDFAMKCQDKASALGSYVNKCKEFYSFFVCVTPFLKF